MIVFISDLHIGNKRVATFHLPARAFQGTFEDIAQHLQNSGETELEIVLLGDVFELIQTDLWLNVPEVESPWGSNPDPGRMVAGLEEIVADNSEIFDLFQGDFARHFRRDDDITVKLTYVPGNHDRMCNLYPQTRDVVIRSLGLTDRAASDPFDWTFADGRHRVFARHGHEYDAYNYGGGTDLSAAAHEKRCIGDTLTAMLAARLPSAVGEALTGKMPAPELQALVRNLGDMFDVRPLAALIPFVSYHVRSLQEPACRDTAVQAIQQTVQTFRQIDYVNQWIRDSGWDGHILAALLALLERVDVFTVGHWRAVMQAAISVRERPDVDPYVDAAAAELRSLRGQGDVDTRYLLYGHTHVPKQVVLSVDIANAPTSANLYVNTGTWRPAHQEAADEQGFAGMKGLTYTIIYAPGTQASQSVEAWTGTLLDDDVS
jgi:UDP-2,3-diacylglucosamine pyrophosphatase LpxH